MLAHFDTYAAAKDLGDLGQTVLFDVFGENNLDRFGKHRVQDLTLTHLMCPHQIQFQFPQTAGVEMSEVADPRHRRAVRY